MRVLVLIDSLAVGGAERSLVSVAPALVARGIDLHVGVLESRGPLQSALRAAGARVTEGLGGASRLATTGALRDHIRDTAPDVVHTTLFEADITGRTANLTTGIPTVSSLVTEAYGPEHLDNPDFKRVKVRLAQLADAVTARTVTRFHAVSESARRVMSQRLFIDPDRVTVIPRGRDPLELGRRSPSRRQAARAGLGLTDREVMILAAGRHYHYKGLDRIVAAMPAVVERVPHARLFVAGREGPSTAALRDTVRAGAVRDRVALLGHRSDLADLMSAADAFVLPSRAEGSPGVLLEAMALESPIVAADIPSVTEIVQDRQAVLVEGEAWADAIAGVVEDPTATGERVVSARRRFERCFTTDAVAEATIRFYRSVS